MKKVAIVQSNYIPWKGYFDFINTVDEFVLLDDVQFTKRDWRNRNTIKTPKGTEWLTVPVRTKSRYSQTIQETQVDGTSWAAKHWRTLVANYATAPHFDVVADIISPLYEVEYTTISDLNLAFLNEICRYLQITTKLHKSTAYDRIGNKSVRLASICAQANADIYVTGPSAWSYLDAKCFTDQGIDIESFNYDGYLPYSQLWGPFEHKVSVLDVMFNCGRTSPDYIFRR